MYLSAAKVLLIDCITCVCNLFYVAMHTPCMVMQTSKHHVRVNIKNITIDICKIAIKLVKQLILSKTIQ